MKRKILSFLLIAAFIISTVPFSFVMAQDGAGGVEIQYPEVTDADGDGLYVGKSATPIDDDTYRIVLEAYTTGTVKTEQSSVPLDIVLVLDQSGSMAYDFNGNSTNNDNNRRQYAMKQAVSKFIDEVADNYSEKANHQISIVTFGSNASTLQGWTKVDDSGKSTLTGEINDLPSSPSGATNAAAGMSQAETLINSLSTSGDNENRQQVVIFFTDGVPTTSSDFSTDVATNAISTAKSLKDQGVTIFTIGIFNGADPNELYGKTWNYLLYDDINCSGEVGSYWGGSYAASIFGSNDFADIDIAAGNRFLNFLSSNFSSADEIGVEKGEYNPGNHLAGNGNGYKITQNFTRDSSDYYMTASNMDDLNQVFTTISNSVSTPSIDLDNSAVIDIVTEKFNIAANDDFKVYTVEATANSLTDNQWGATTPLTLTRSDEITSEIDRNYNTVKVQGFNFNDNFVSTGPKPGTTEDYGRKLVIEFNVERKPGFIGGNAVPTNSVNSGVYTVDENGEPDYTVDYFDVPSVDAYIEFNYDVADQTIFLGESANLSERINDLTKNGDFLIDGIINEFVNIEYLICKGNFDENNLPLEEDIVAYYKIDAAKNSGEWIYGSENLNPYLTSDTEYTVFCQVSPVSSSGAIQNEIIIKHFTVYVISGTLTINKTGGQAGEMYVFNVMKDDTKYTDVTVVSNGSVTLTNLPAGTYTVEEDSSWAWRYTPTYIGDQTFAISSAKPSHELTCNNTKSDDHWLNSYAYAENVYGEAEGGAQQ